MITKTISIERRRAALGGMAFWALSLGVQALGVQAAPRMEEIVVTGELLDRRLEQTVSSVAVIDRQEIERSAIADVYELIRMTPNAGLEDSDYGVGGMNLRGVGSYGASGAGAYAAYGTTSVVVLDGVGLPRSAMGYADLASFDLASVEIFRGPQSTSQGRNAMAGAVVINTVEPALGNHSPQLFGRASAGNQGRRQWSLGTELSLLAETLSLRIVHDQRDSDGDIVNPTRGEDDWAGSDSKTTRLRLKWQPGGVDGRYTALLGATQLDKYQGSRYVPRSEKNSRHALADVPVDYRSESQLFSLDQRLWLGERWQLQAITAYVESDTFSRFDQDYGADASGATEQWEEARDVSQELRLSFSGERLQAILGAYYYEGHNGDRQRGYTSINGALAMAGLCGVEFLCSAPLGNILYNSATPTEVVDSAVFGELDWALTPRLTLSVGLRADREKNSRVISTFTDGDSPVAALAVGVLRGVGALPANGDFRVGRSFSEVLPKFSLRYELADNWYLGGAYAEGYRPGGDGYNQVSGRYFRFDSERTRNTELSLKGRHPASGLSVSLNLFHTRWEDMQVQGGEGVDSYIENAGLASINGGELALRWQALSNLGLVASYGVIRGEFEEFVNLDGDDLSGNHLPKAPAYSGALALEWWPLETLIVRPALEWASATPSLPENRPEHELPAYHLLNLSLRWQLGGITLFANGSNLTNEAYWKDANAYNSQGIDVVSLGPERRWWAGLEFAF